MERHLPQERVRWHCPLRLTPQPDESRPPEVLVSKLNATMDSAQTLCNVVPIVAKRMSTRLRRPQCRSPLSSDQQDMAANGFLVHQNAQLATFSILAACHAPRQAASSASARDRPAV